MRKTTIWLSGFLLATQVSAATPHTGRVLFDCYSVNYAWGFTLSGYYVDDAGTVHAYQSTGPRWLPTTPAENERSAYSEAELRAKYRAAGAIARVDATTLKEKIALIERAANGAITRKAAGADQGRQACVAYVVSPRSGNYLEIVLNAEGDVQERNAAREAQELLQWLRSLDPAK
jgi:hypothetical protein